MTPLFVVTIRLVDHQKRKTTFRCNLIKEGDQNIIEYKDNEHNISTIAAMPEEFMKDLDSFLNSFGQKIVANLEKLATDYESKVIPITSSSSKGE